MIYKIYTDGLLIAQFRFLDLAEEFLKNHEDIPNIELIDEGRN